MIKFFRKIRQNLLKEGKTSKYFKYALGEIVLVVIGILIALQINNWNEDRKDNSEEQKILINLNTEFKSNLIKLDSIILGINYSIKSMDSLLNIMNKTLDVNPNEINLNRLISRTINIPTYFPSSMVLRELESSGKLAKLKNQKIKDLFYSWNSKVDHINVIGEINSTAFGDYLNYIKANGSLRSIDFEGNEGVTQSILGEDNLHLLSDLKFENSLDDHHVSLKIRLDSYTEAVKIISAIIKQTEPTTL
tara:strand:- start:276 stop:1022 length:747 start_codon:yes stop_codon:yes gene_type:complete